ncbi:MAG: mechanosensitive ion channel family protein [Bacillota bacterium]
MAYQDKLIELTIQYGTKLVGALLVFLIGRWIIKFIMKYIEKWSGEKLDPTLHSFILPITKAILFILLLITVTSTLGIQMTSFVAILGAASFAIGLALQGSLSNFAGGVLILTFRPFNVGDFVEVNGKKGKVNSIQILYTKLTSRDNKQIVIPNGIVSNSTVTNYSVNNTRRVDLDFGIGYDDDIDQVKEVLEDIVSKHEKVLEDPAPTIRVGEHAGSSVNFNVLLWTKSENYWDVYYDMMENVKKRFDEEDINIPYPQMDVHLDK